MFKLNEKTIVREKFPNNETKVKDFEESLVDDENLLEFEYTDKEQLITLMFIKHRIDSLAKKCKLKIICDCKEELFTREIMSFIHDLCFTEIEFVLNFKYHTDIDLVNLYSINKIISTSELKKHKVNLFIWYMPYSRMDRKIEGDVFTLEYVCLMLNSMCLDKVYIVEPHSNVTMNLLKNSYAIYPAKEWLPIIKEKVGFKPTDSIVLPDKGAKKRYGEFEKDICILDKKRNPTTGEILSMNIIEGSVNKDSTCIIIDDLCSKGGTFEYAARILKSLGAKKVYLVVTHCEENIFNGKLLDSDSPIDKIFTSRSILSTEHEKIEFIDIEVTDYV